jgi:hypothetical protein
MKEVFAFLLLSIGILSLAHNKPSIASFKHHYKKTFFPKARPEFKFWGQENWDVSNKV